MSAARKAGLWFAGLCIGCAVVAFLFVTFARASTVDDMRKDVDATSERTARIESASAVSRAADADRLMRIETDVRDVKNMTIDLYKFTTGHAPATVQEGKRK